MSDKRSQWSYQNKRRNQHLFVSVCAHSLSEPKLVNLTSVMELPCICENLSLTCICTKNVSALVFLRIYCKLAVKENLSWWLMVNTVLGLCLQVWCGWTTGTFPPAKASATPCAASPSLGIWRTFILTPRSQDDTTHLVKYERSPISCCVSDASSISALTCPCLFAGGMCLPNDDISVRENLNVQRQRLNMDR